MSRRLSIAAAVLSVSAAELALGGCATVTSGTTQAITVDSEPQQAQCTLTREGQELGSVTTPAPLTIKRHASTVHVLCRKEGFEDGRVIMNSRYETASSGNFLLGGIIGVMVDASSGASSRYEQYVMVRLAALSPADQVAAAARPKPAPTPTPVAVSTPAPAAAGAAPPAAPTGPFDGEYKGGFQFDTWFSDGLRWVELRVAGGAGTGKVIQERCSGIPGPLTLTIAPSGVIAGEIDILERGNCAPLKGTITGRAEGGSLKLTVAAPSRKPIEFTLTRTNPKAAG